jgi:hypothetical protein
MDDDKKKTIILAVVAGLAVLAALAMGIRSNSGSGETETDFDAVPPKGIGKVERD